MTRKSKISDHTYEHKNGDRKVSVLDLPGVYIVRGSQEAGGEERQARPVARRPHAADSRAVALMTCKTIAAAATLALAVTAAPASASGYHVSQREAERLVVQAAELRYEANGVTADDSYCRPQGRPSSKLNQPFSGRYHRWVCTWVGTDIDSDDVYGTFRITGHSDGTFGFLPLYGGLRWF